MMHIKDVGDQEILNGVSVASIVRRVLGRRASYRVEHDPSFSPACRTAMVVMPDGQVVGRIFIDIDQDGFRWE